MREGTPQMSIGSTSGWSNNPEYAWKMLLLLLAPATFIMALDRIVVAVTGPMLRASLGLTLPQLGLIYSVYFWGYAAMQIPAGAVVQRLGSRLTLFVALLLWSVLTILTPLTTSFSLLLLVRIFMGVGQSADWPAAIVGINRLFAEEQRPRANSVLLCALYLGSVVGAPLATHLAAAFGLRAAFATFGIAGCLFAMVWWSGYADGFSPAKLATQHRSTVASTDHIKRFSILSRLFPLMLAHICTCFLLGFYVSIYSTYLIEVRGLTLTSLGFYLACNYICLCVAVLVTGQALVMLAKRNHDVRSLRCYVACGAILVAGGCTCLVFFVPTQIEMLIFTCASLLALGACQVVTWITVQDLGRENTGIAVGLVSLGGNLAGGAAPVVCAMLAERGGTWAGSFVTFGVVGMVGGAMWMFVRARRIQPEERQHLAAPADAS
jgi:predicted MFS family arabinose efflux permease